jgi:hypothetical protein
MLLRNVTFFIYWAVNNEREHISREAIKKPGRALQLFINWIYIRRNILAYQQLIYWIDINFIVVFFKRFKR